MPFLLLILMTFWIDSAAANAVRVQTGEHPDFSRVVVILPEGVDWQLGRDDDGYVLRSAVADGYNIEDFFDLIPRDRIKDAIQDTATGELRLSVDCECHADAFVDSPNILVVDIRDGLPPQDSLYEGRLDQSVAQTENISPITTGRPFKPQRNPLIPIIVADEAQPPDVTPRPAAQTLPSAAADQKKQTQVTFEATEPSEDVSGLAELEASITASLGRALSQGLLEADVIGRDGEPVGWLPNGLSRSEAPGIRATTGVDQAAIPDDPRIPVTQEGANCVSNAYFDIANWGDDRPFAAQISEARASLTSESDKLLGDAVLNLARKFIYFGFGREAIQTLELDGVQSQERRYLQAVSQIIDGDPIDRGLFAQQASCASDVALWALLAAGEDEQDTLVDRAAILRAFKSLPAGLQAHLAPIVAEQFVSVGDEDAAVQVIAVLAAKPEVPLEAQAAEVVLKRALGDEQAATDQVARVIDTDPHATPEFMIALLTTSVKNQTLIDADTFTLANAMRFENRGLPIATELARAQTRAYLYQDEFGAALDLIDELNPNGAIELVEEFVVAAAERMPDDDFLVFAFGELPKQVSPIGKNAVTKRLLALGFPQYASTLLSDPLEGPFALDGAYLRAEVALALADPAGAIDALPETTSDRAKGILQIANGLLSENGIMATAYATDDQTLYDWRRGDWSALSSSEDPLLQAASVVALEKNVPAFDLDAPLKSGRALLDDSQRSRAVMTDLLNRFDSPADF